MMKDILPIWALFPIVFMTAEVVNGYSAESAANEANLVIVDNDFTGPPDTLFDLRCALMFLESPNVKVLGFRVVTGDGWRDEEVSHLLRLEEIAGHTDVPVVPGSVYPLVNTQEEMLEWEKRFGHTVYKGAWDQKEDRKDEPAYNPHGPCEVPVLPEGSPTIRPKAGNAPEFMVEQVHAYPYQVTVFAAGPLTDIALAVRMDPQFPRLAKGLVFMGAALPPNYPDFNFRFDPEAARIVLSAPWASITAIADVTYHIKFEQPEYDRIQTAGSAIAKFVATYSKYDLGKSHLWDEIAAAVLIDPSIVLRAELMHLNVDIDHQEHYGAVIPLPANSAQRNVRVVEQVDVDRFKQEFVSRMTGPPSSQSNP
jgi:inosine-uridine nucleoside N-ribohydrolase